MFTKLHKEVVNNFLFKIIRFYKTWIVSTSILSIKYLLNEIFLVGFVDAIIVKPLNRKPEELFCFIYSLFSRASSAN